MVISSLASLGVEALAKTSVAPELGKFFYYRASACSSAHCRGVKAEEQTETVLFISLCVSLKC